MSTEVSILKYAPDEKAALEKDAMSALAVGCANADMFDELGDAGFDEPDVDTKAGTVHLTEFVWDEARENIIGKRRYKVSVELVSETEGED